jgi:WD40 repeat protein
VKIWNLDNGEILKSLQGDEGISSVSWSRDNSKIVSGSGGKSIIIWDVRTGELLNTLEGHSAMVLSVSWNHDDSKLVSGSLDKTIKIWSI